MLKIGLETDTEKLRSEGFIPVRKIDNPRFPENTWRYDHNIRNETYFVVEDESKRTVKPIAYFDLETSRFVFAQSPCFSLWVSKSNLDGDQEPEHAPDFSLRVLENEEVQRYIGERC